jgi:hypothetical protein
MDTNSIILSAKILKTSGVWINSIFLMMNLMVLFRIYFVQLINIVKFVLLRLSPKLLSRFTNWFMPVKSIQLVAG